MITRKVNDGAIQLIKDQGSQNRLIRPSTNKYEAVSTDMQTQINMSFAVEIANLNNFLLYVDGFLLTYGVGNDYTFTEVRNGQSSKVVLSSPLVAGLPIQAFNLGILTSSLNGSTLQANINDKVDRGFFDFDRVESVYIDVPFTQIQYREKMIDLENDLSMHMGVKRIEIDQIYASSSEFGPNGELVYKTTNDYLNQMRFVGSWVNLSGTSGALVKTSGVFTNPNEYVEVTFWGTGLNLLGNSAASNTLVADIYVDSIFNSSLSILTPTSSILNGRNYRTNNVLSLVSGLTEGLHTVRIQGKVGNNDALFLYGFEFLNESTQISVNSGVGYAKGLKNQLLEQALINYNSDFESGALGTKGGRVAAYLKEDGTVGKSLNPVDINALYLSSANHTNEEVVRRYNWKEFGANRGDDFSTLTASLSNRAFTLDDGTTTLVGNGVQTVSDQVVDLSNNGTSFLTITFIGSGISLIRNDLQAGGSQTTEYTLDGTIIGTPVTSGYIDDTLIPIASGLPYGTHTLKIRRVTAVTVAAKFKNFIIYQPKTPEIPDNANLIGSYNILADFVAPLGSIGSAYETIPAGVIAKMNIREYTYVNGAGGTIDWNTLISVGAAFLSGWQLYTNRTGSMALQFWGTGFVYRFFTATTGMSDGRIFINGVALTTANFPSASVSVVGGSGTYNMTTGVFNTVSGGTIQGNSLVVTGLPLDEYNVRIAQNSVGANNQLQGNEFLVITPIYSPKSSLPYDLQNTMNVGSNSLGDERVFDFDLIERPNISVAKNTVGGSTTSNVPVQIPQLYIPFYMSKDGFVEIDMKISILDTQINGEMWTYLFVDGNVVDTCNAVTYDFHSAPMNNKAVVQLSKGFHYIEGKYFNVNSISTIIDANTGQLIVKELK